MIFQLLDAWSEDYIGTWSFEDEKIDESRISELYKEYNESGLLADAQFDDFMERFHPEIKIKNVILENVYV